MPARMIRSSQLVCSDEVSWDRIFRARKGKPRWDVALHYEIHADRPHLVPKPIRHPSVVGQEPRLGPHQALDQVRARSYAQGHRTPHAHDRQH